jgi:hypothetical protein
MPGGVTTAIGLRGSGEPSFLSDDEITVHQRPQARNPFDMAWSACEGDLPGAGRMPQKRRAVQKAFARARWDTYWRDDAYVARNWLDHDPGVVRLSPFMKDHQFQRVCDLGRGVGRHLVYLSRRNFELHGLDLSPAGVELCQKELAQQQATVQVYVNPAATRARRELLRRLMSLMRKRAELLAHIQNTNSQYYLLR